jgi:hypothetical protein
VLRRSTTLAYEYQNTKKPELAFHALMSEAARSA